MKSIDLNLARLGDGSVQEKFDYEMEQVMRNVLDPNTDAEKKRQIVLTIDIEPDEEREMLFVSVSSKSKLVPRKSASTKILFGRGDNGKIEAAELKSGVRGQTYFDPDDGKVKTDTGQDIDDVEKQEKEVIDFRAKAKKG